MREMRKKLKNGDEKKLRRVVVKRACHRRYSRSQIFLIIRVGRGTENLIRLRGARNGLKIVQRSTRARCDRRVVDVVIVNVRLRGVEKVKYTVV